MNKINATDLKNLLDKDEAILIDVREPIENRIACIDGSCLLPLNAINEKTLPITSKTIVIHCKSGARSISACNKLLSLNPNLKLYYLEGGINAWKEAGFDIKCLNNVLPIERQTQIAVGFIAFLGTILGTFINNKFYILPGIIGAGLMSAGITGWCGMAKLLAKMPWNK